MNISDNLMAYLRSWYETSTGKKREAGIEVTLTFDEFLSLINEKQMTSLQEHADNRKLRYLQKRDNKYSYVLTWKSYADCSTGVFSKDTAMVCSRQKSAAINLPQAGDPLRASHKANIARGLKGKEKSEEHREALSESLSGKPKKGWSPERKAARSEAMKKRHAEKKAAREAAFQQALKDNPRK